MKLKEMLSSKVEGGERGWWGSSNAKPSEGERYSSLLHIYTRVSWDSNFHVSMFIGSCQIFMPLKSNIVV